MFKLRVERRADDRGAIAVMTAIVGSVVLVGSAALALDVGQLYSERRQLQNGADAAAIAIAQSCARGLADAAAPCNTGLGAALVNGNALDGRSQVSRICGTAPGLASCPASSSSGASCPPAATASPRYVEVHVRTGTADGSNVVSPAFLRVLPGFDSYAGTTVAACARAGYGAPGNVISELPIGVSQCVVDRYKTTHGGTFGPSTLTTATSTELKHWEAALELHKASGPCATGGSGSTAPGHFGWLDTSGCSIETTLGALVPGDSGNSNPNTTLGCTDSYLAERLGKVVYLPIYDSVTGTGSDAQYRVVSFAAFLFTGWELSGTSHMSTVTGSSPCKSPVTCISGVFLYDVQPPPAPISSAPQYSLSVVQLLG
jgi:Flp pilus assembly protein TadG